MVCLKQTIGIRIGDVRLETAVLGLVVEPERSSEVSCLITFLDVTSLLKIEILMRCISNIFPNPAMHM